MRPSMTSLLYSVTGVNCGREQQLMRGLGLFFAFSPHKSKTEPAPRPCFYADVCNAPMHICLPSCPDNQRPTKANIRRWMSWLVEGSVPGDSLFFSYVACAASLPTAICSRKLIAGCSVVFTFTLRRWVF